MIRNFALVLLFIALAPLNAQAKDLSNRLGIGYKNQFGADVPGVAVQYYPGADLGVSATLGVDTQQSSSRFGFMAKLYRVVFQEDSMNFYMGAGAGLLSQELTGRTDSGFELMGFGGSEFFLPGLENLGFSVEMGVAVTSLSNGVRFRTFGDSPLRAGMIFYF
ncbi:MAG: organic solvent tolerance protein [Bdellovibrionota bacterium]